MVRRILSVVRAVLLAAGGLFAVSVGTPLTHWAAARLATPWTDADDGVLILLGGSSVGDSDFGRFAGEGSYWRSLYAVSAWREGRFRKVLICGSGSDETLKPILLSNGVPEGAIVVENRSVNTRENGFFARQILQHEPGPYVLMTSDYHMFRAFRCFRSAGVPVFGRPVPDALKRSHKLQCRWEVFCNLARELAAISYYKARGWI